MTAFDPLLIPLGIVVLAAALGAMAAAVRALTRRRTRRVVEMPNSHYTSQIVRASETRSRWHDIILDNLHELNRQEVVRLLARLDATSIDALRPREREFLDRMAELAGTTSAQPPHRTTEPPRNPELRHRPA